MLYVALFEKSVRRMTAYRAATLAGLVTNFFFGALRAFIFVALYRDAGVEEVAGYTLADAVTFTALTQAAIAPLMLFGWWDVMRTIQSGDIASDLTKPIDLYRFWLAQDLGRAAFSFAARGVPIVLAYQVFFDLVWPSSMGGWLAFGLSAALALLISFSWRFLVNVTAFWTTDAHGMGRVAYMSVLLLSGMLIPVAYFPETLQSIVWWTPFPSMVNVPVEVWLGMHGGPALARILGVQALWAVALAALARAVYARGVSRLVVQGG
jgi:ABC-2 type transport system permease protein